MLYFIQGFFFQKYEWLDIGMGEDGDWQAAVMNCGLCRFMFSGIICPDKDSALGALVGQMNDRFGESALTDVRMWPERVTFTKKYAGRKDIYYEFRKEGYLWVGGYSGEAVGGGAAKCIITEVPENIMKP